MNHLALIGILLAFGTFLLTFLLLNSELTEVIRRESPFSGVVPEEGYNKIFRYSPPVPSSHGAKARLDGLRFTADFPSSVRPSDLYLVIISDEELIEDFDTEGSSAIDSLDDGLLFGPMTLSEMTNSPSLTIRNWKNFSNWYEIDFNFKIDVSQELTLIFLIQKEAFVRLEGGVTLIEIKTPLSKLKGELFSLVDP